MDYTSVYKNMFKQASYNNQDSVSYSKAIEFINKIPNVKSVLNIGSGKGNLEKVLLKRNNLKIISCDLDNFLENVIPHQFIRIDLSNYETLESLPKVDALTCLDVLEHIEEKHLDYIFSKLSSLSNNLFFTIANHSDVINGIELHLIQKPKNYWDIILQKYFDIKQFEEYYNGRLLSYELKTKKVIHEN